MWNNTYESMNKKIHRFLKCILKTSHVRVLTTVKISEGDGVWLLGKAIRYGPKNVLPHMSKFVSHD